MLDIRLQRIHTLELEQRKLYRRGLLMLLFFAVSFSCLAWERALHFPGSWYALCLGSPVLIALYVAYAFARQRELEHIRDSKGIAIAFLESKEPNKARGN